MNIEQAREVLIDLRTEFTKVKVTVIDAALVYLIAEVERMRGDLVFVERWANHHGQKPCHTPAEILSVIQHYPAVMAITKGYTDRVLPTTPDPYAETAMLKTVLAGVKQDEVKQRKVLEQALEALENGRRVRYGLGGTEYQPPLENAAITAIQEQLKS